MVSGRGVLVELRWIPLPILVLAMPATVLAGAWGRSRSDTSGRGVDRSGAVGAREPGARPVRPAHHVGQASGLPVTHFRLAAAPIPIVNITC